MPRLHSMRGTNLPCVFGCCVCLAAGIILAPDPAGAQPLPRWTRDWGEGAQEYVSSVTIAGDGDIVASGLTTAGGHDILLLRYSPDGDLRWVTRYAGPDSGDIAYPFDMSCAVEETADGQIAVAGYSAGPGGRHVTLSLFSDTGTLLWNRSYTGAGWAEAYGFDLVPGGGFVISGITSSAVDPGDAFVLRTNEQGDTLWTSILQRPRLTGAYGVVATREGRFLITGSTRNDGSSGVTDGLVALLDADGSVLWEETPADFFGSWPIQLADGCFVIGGVHVGAWGDWDIGWRKLNPEGGLVWARHESHAGHQWINRLREAAGGGLILAAEGSVDSWVTAFKTDADGLVQWGHSYARGWGRDIVPRDDGGYVLVGRTNDGTGGNGDCYVTRLEPDAWLTSVAGQPGAGACAVVLLGNPLRAGSVLSVDMPHDGTLRVEIRDATGRRVRVAHDSPTARGAICVAVDPGDLAPGVYVVEARTGTRSLGMAKALVVR